MKKKPIWMLFNHVMLILHSPYTSTFGVSFTFALNCSHLIWYSCPAFTADYSNNSTITQPYAYFEKKNVDILESNNKTKCIKVLMNINTDYVWFWLMTLQWLAQISGHLAFKLWACISYSIINALCSVVFSLLNLYA